jgi:ATP-dependent DNA helicase DinG
MRKKDLQYPNPGYPKPSEFGLPPKFSDWRPGQYEAITAGIDSDKTYIAHAAATGSGKSLYYIAHALMMGMRTCVLTSTKALQTQLVQDFGACGLTDIRGQGNYRCKELWPGGSHFSRDRPKSFRNCDWGPCHTGYNCELRASGCDYYEQLNKAEKSQLVVTNYSYWFAINAIGGIGEFDLLVCDEAHSAPDELSSFLSINLSREEIAGLLNQRFPSAQDPKSWTVWAKNASFQAHDMGEHLRKNSHPDQIANERSRARKLQYLEGKLDSLSRIKGEWVKESEAGDVSWDPVWPAPYAHKLFQGIPKVLLISATVRPKTCEMLGIDKDDLDFFEYTSPFPVDRRPTIHIYNPNGLPMRINHRAKDHVLRAWVNRIDQVIERRKDRKGVIHTVSYARRNYLNDHSKHNFDFITHDTEDTARAMDVFKKSRFPAVLLSPSASTGYDFPYEECEYSIIIKIPFPDTRSSIMKARHAQDKDYTMYIAMQELVQMAGRGMRAADDRHEVLIVDDNADWFLQKYRHFAPEWFMDSYRRVRNVPDPPRKLYKKGGTYE